MNDKTSKTVARETATMAKCHEAVEDFIYSEAARLSEMDQLFRAYVNNKIMILQLVLVQRKPRIDPVVKIRVIAFLEDIYHHFMPSDAPLILGHMFRYMIIFMKKYPHVKPYQKDRAKVYAGLIYRMLNHHLY